MEQSTDQLEEIKGLVLETLEDYALAELYSEDMTEHYYKSSPSNINKYRLALRIADYIIYSNHISLRDATF